LLSSLKKIFEKSDEGSKKIDIDNELYILCGLMIEAAQSDGRVEENEVNQITSSLVSIFKKDKSEVERAIELCIKEIDEPKSLHAFTSKLNKMFSNEKKVQLIETLWTIILSDGQVHEFESNLIRRLSGLLYISGVSCGNAKKRALENLKNVQ
tara:strand:- start:446 stop:904 length:459 start_codon:yes stop_codon:yes gene_type:complete